MAGIQKSPGLEHLPFELRLEYEDILRQAQDDIAPVEGAQTSLRIILERFAFVYCMLRNMERSLDSPEFSVQRYNQMTSLWIKISSGLMSQYATLYATGAVNDLFVRQIITIISEEVDDPDVLRRLRHRLEHQKAQRDRTVEVLSAEDPL